MKFLSNLVNRVFNHWQQTLIGLLILGLGYMLYTGRVSEMNFGVILTGILGAYKILIAKDPDKIENKLPPKNEP
jgi:hypothetical protein